MSTDPDPESPVVDDVVRCEAEYGEVEVRPGGSYEGRSRYPDVGPAPGHVVTEHHQPTVLPPPLPQYGHRLPVVQRVVRVNSA